MKKLLAVFIISFVSLSALAFELKLEGQYTPNEAAKANSAIDAVKAALPAHLKQSMPYTIKVIFDQMRLKQDRINLGRAELSNKIIYLSSEFLSEKPKQSYFEENRLRKTLAHEVSHFYDHENIESEEIKSLKFECRNSNRKDRDSQMEGLCRTLSIKRTTISQDPQFLALTGWTYSKSGLENMNTFKRRSPDPYALTNPYETFPVYFESYLFDPDFACRMPSVSAYFDRKFAHTIHSRSCSDNLTWYLAGDANPFRQISKKQIWAIDYFWASEGSEASSGFGHAMLRLVVCRPDRQPSPECYKDFDHHLVLSFAATSEAQNFGNIDGLTGKYPLNLYAMTFHKAKSQYNLQELRDLYASPLKLSTNQKNMMLDILYEIHWNFEGKYYFTNRNCTTEISRLIMASGVSVKTAASISSTTPSALLQKILSSPLKYDHLRYKEDLQKNDLLFFKSSQKNVDAALALISTALAVEFDTIEDYISDIDNRHFSKLLEKAKSNKRVLYATYYLESIKVARLKALEIQKDLEQNLAMKETINQEAGKTAKAKYSYRFIGSFLKQSAYGLPSPDELSEVQKNYQLKFDQDRLALEEKSNKISRYIEATTNDQDISAGLNQLVQLMQDK